MQNTIKITYGKYGCFLSVNGFAIKRAFDNDILVTPCCGTPNNWIATEFVSIQALRKFWNDYRQIIVHKTMNYKGVLVSKEYQIAL